MRTLFALTLAATLLSAMPIAGAQQQAPNAQQDRMKACNSEAGAQKLSGDARKSFMSDCLAGKTPQGSGGSAMTQQDKMKACNTQAGSQQLAGDARKQFMSNCLKGP